MTAAEIVEQARNQQRRAGRDDADVVLMIPGKWPDRSDRKRLAGRKGPLGRCMAEYEDAVLCLFKADELMAYFNL